MSLYEAYRNYKNLHRLFLCLPSTIRFCIFPEEAEPLLQTNPSSSSLSAINTHRSDSWPLSDIGLVRGTLQFERSAAGSYESWAARMESLQQCVQYWAPSPSCRGYNSHRICGASTGRKWMQSPHFLTLWTLAGCHLWRVNLPVGVSPHEEVLW